MAFSIRSELSNSNVFIRQNPSSCRTQQSSRSEYLIESPNGYMLKNPSTMKKGRNLTNSSASVFVPDLNIPETLWSSTNDLTYTHHRDDKTEKEIPQTEAFNEWLAAKIDVERYAKRKTMELEAEQRKKRQEETEAHNRLKNEKVKEWLKQKRQKDEERRLKLIQDKEEIHVDKNDSNASITSFKAWLAHKQEYEKNLKDKANKNVKQKEESFRHRQELAKREYEKWIKNARLKPKPVPFNQGLLSLRGTVSKLYINPNPWLSPEE